MKTKQKIEITEYLEKLVKENRVINLPIDAELEFISPPGNKDLHYSCEKCNEHNIVIGWKGEEVKNNCTKCNNEQTLTI